MTRVEQVAAAYGLTTAEVAAWPGRLVDIFYRNATARGWLMTNPTQQETP